MLIHSFVNLFAGGRSTIKVVLFFAYLFFLLAVYFFARKKKDTAIPLWPGAALLGALYGLGLLLYHRLHTSVGLGLSDFFITGNNDALSSNTFFHTHVAKGYIGIVLNLLGLQITNADSGMPYVGILPSILLLFGAILTIATIGYVVGYFRFTVKTFIISRSSFRERGALFFGYAILSFSLVKTAIDGGVASIALWAGILVVFLWYMSKNDTQMRVLADGLILTALALVAIGFFVEHSSDVLFSIAALLALYVLLFVLSMPIVHRTLLLAAIATLALSWWQTSARDRELAAYGHIKIQKGETYYLYNRERIEPSLVTATTTVTVKEIAKRQGVNLSYLPVMVPWQTCIPFIAGNMLEATLLTDDQPQFTNDRRPSSVVMQSKEQSFDGVKWHTSVLVALPPCMPQPLNGINDMLLSQGLSSYILVNPLSYDGSIRF